MSDQASTIQVNTIEPQSGTTLTVGKSGQNLVVNADSLKANVAKDAGANALFTSDGSGNLSGLNNGLGSAQILISTTTVSSAVAGIAFTSGIDSTYKEYVFEFFTLNPVTDNVQFEFQTSTDGGSNYNVTTTSTFFTAWHNENNTNQALGYTAASDQAQGTAYQPLWWSLGGDADECGAGELHLCNPASTTFAKIYYSRLSGMGDSPMAMDLYCGGYFNTTSAINAINFKMSSGNIEAGKIKMYGIK